MARLWKPNMLCAFGQFGKHEENASKFDSIDSYLINNRTEVGNCWLVQKILYKKLKIFHGHPL